MDTARTETTCYRHPRRATSVRCTRCDRYICPDCMREAPVGHRCPECVKGENRTVRQARTIFGGKPVSTPLTTYTLILLNVLAYVAELVDQGLVARFDNIGTTLVGPDGGFYVDDGTVYPGFSAAGVAHGEWYRLITSAFLHEVPGPTGFGITHLLFNMMWLWILGRILEDRLGRARFLAIYLAGLFGASVLQILIAPTTGAIGASGAGFGLVAAYFILTRRLSERPLNPNRLIVTYLLWLVLSSSFASWEGHLGGLLAGGLAAVGIAYAPRKRRTAWQAAAVGGVVLVLAVLLVAKCLQID